ncbi:phage tail terminator-like protein [Aureimonas sp. D3]|uniref:phage tail terminator-like protein n=1 Tax=Aureimonas sp. D3 TaxID=1638164 RepID=UPI000785F26F|nr:phage tail terminator-like protein [Aureimonas sp. D3]
MARFEVVLAVRTFLAANWTECPIVEENTGFETPKNGSPFVMVQYPYSISERLTFGAPGANTHRETGGFLISVNVPRGEGVDRGRQWADRLADILRGKTFGHLRIQTPNSPPTDDRNETGNYFQLSFAVPYRFDYVG